MVFHQPIWKICSSKWFESSPRFRGANNKSLSCHHPEIKVPSLPTESCPVSVSDRNEIGALPRKSTKDQPSSPLRIKTNDLADRRRRRVFCANRCQWRKTRPTTRATLGYPPFPTRIVTTRMTWNMFRLGDSEQKPSWMPLDEKKRIYPQRY